MRSRITSSVHASPKTSSAKWTGQSDFRWRFFMPRLCTCVLQVMDATCTCKKQVNGKHQPTPVVCSLAASAGFAEGEVHPAAAEPRVLTVGERADAVVAEPVGAAEDDHVAV